MSTTAGQTPSCETVTSTTGRLRQQETRGCRPSNECIRCRRVIALIVVATVISSVIALTATITSYGRLADTVAPAPLPNRPRAAKPTSIPDFVSINATRGLDEGDIAALLARSTEAGLPATVVHQGTLDLTVVERNGTITKASPDGTGYPMSTLAVDPTQIAATTSGDIASTLRGGLVVAGATASHNDDLRVGDRITMTGWNGTSAILVIGFVAPDESVSGTELMMSIATARALGLDRPFSVRVWGLTNRTAALAFGQSTSAAWTRQPIRVRSSWKDPLLDDTVPQSRIKMLLGEFWVRRGADGAVQVDPGWKTADIIDATLPLIGSVRCHTVVATAATAVLRELHDAGLASLIHAADTRLNGGCFRARVTRSLIGNSGHNLSRHAWGAAIDVNPSQNPYGGPSRMDQRVIDAFRRHGFVWGGTFLIPDPMHFEFVGNAPR